MTAANDQRCARCGHTRYLHNGTRGLGCHGSTIVYADSVSGPPRPVPGPCRCTGFKAGGNQMGPNQPAGTPVTGIAADVAEAGQVAAAAETALTELTGALHAARMAYDAAVTDAHHAYLEVMGMVRHAPAATPPAPGTPA